MQEAIFEDLFRFTGTHKCSNTDLLIKVKLIKVKLLSFVSRGETILITIHRQNYFQYVSFANFP